VGGDDVADGGHLGGVEAAEVLHRHVRVLRVVRPDPCRARQAQPPETQIQRLVGGLPRCAPGKRRNMATAAATEAWNCLSPGEELSSIGWIESQFPLPEGQELQ